MAFNITSARREQLLANGLYLVTKVDHETVNSIIDWIMDSLPSKNTFTLVINSSGGSPSAAIYFASFLATLYSSAQVKGVAFGECGSAAVALLQCCHRRIAVKHCGFFVHHVNSKIQVSCHGFNISKIEAELLAAKYMEEELIELQCARSGISKEVWMKLADEGEELDGRVILPSRALHLGLIDEVVERYEIF